MFVGTEGDYNDGVQWRTYPPAGQVGVFDDSHAEHLVAAGRGEYVKEEKPEPEKATGPSGEEKRSAAEPATTVTPPAGTARLPKKAG